MSDPSCIFCRIVSGEIPAKKIYEDEQIIAFHDLEPQAPLHILITPKEHIPDLPHVKVEQEELLGKMLLVGSRLAEGEGVKGYRIVANTRSQGGQTVFHLHFHLLGGRQMTWPPG